MSKTLFKVPVSNEEGGLLAKFYKQIISELGITEGRYISLVDAYVKRNNELAGRYNHIKTVYRSQVVNATTGRKITWKVLIRSVFFILNVKRITITFTLRHHNGDDTSHIMAIENDPTQELKNDDED